MLLGGKFAKPIAARGFVHSEHFTTRLGSPLTLIQAPEGRLLTESLTAILERSDQQVVWLRFGWEDFDPATCLLSLIEAFQVVNAKVGAATMEKMRRLPGPIQGWSGLFIELSHEINAHLPAPTTLVLENLHHPAQLPLTLALLGKHFLPALARQVRVILISPKNLPPYSLQTQPEIVTAKDLCLSAAAIRCLFQASELISEPETIRRAVRLVDGSPLGLAGICMAGQLLGKAYVQDVLRRQTTQAGFCTQIAHDWLSAQEEGEVQSIGTLLSLEYNHPDINQSQTGRPSLAPSPWDQELDRGWIRPHSLWLTGIEAALRLSPAFRRQSIHTAAEYLCRSGALIPGIGLFFATGAFTSAAGYLAQYVEEMLGLGQWDLLRSWLEHLPGTILEGQPRLLHAAGEIKSASGDLAGAAHDFQRAGERYLQEDDRAGNITSLLAISTLAARQGEIGEAWSSAYRALQVAQTSKLPRQESSAELQISLLALQAGDILNALPHLEIAARLAHIIGDAGLMKRIDDLHALALEQAQRQQQLQQQHQRYLAAQQAERTHQERLRQAIQAPLDFDDSVWSFQSWLQAPLMLKPGARFSTNGHLANGHLANGKPSLRGKISAWLRRSLANGHRQNAEIGSTEGIDALENELPAPPESVLHPSGSEIDASVVEIQSAPVSAALAGQPAPVLQSPKMDLPGLSAYMLGEFRLLIDDTLVEQIPSGRGGVLLKYLIYHHKRRIPRDELMDVFWPEVGPESARNRLNVTLNKIRAALRQASSLEIILFEADKYFLNPELRIWIDVDQFENILIKARQLEEDSQADQVVQLLEVTANLYQGDFLAGDLYEEWTVLIRERLRLAYLDALYQLSRCYYEGKHYAACATLCQSILARDNCREDVHCLLMRCYAHQGQVPLALRQYQVCVQALRQELDVAPAATTMALNEQLRRRELTEPQPAN